MAPKDIDYQPNMYFLTQILKKKLFFTCPSERISSSKQKYTLKIHMNLSN